MGNLIKSAVAVALCAALSCGGAAAQTAPPQVELAPFGGAEFKWVHVKLKHIKPSLIAWWFDPAHNPEPRQDQKPRSLLDGGSYIPIPEMMANGERPASVVPAENTHIISIDPQNVLIMEGPDEEIDKIKRLIATLDQPITMLRVEAQTIQLTPPAAQALGLVARPKTPGQKSDATVVALTPGAEQDLGRLIVEKQATLVSKIDWPIANNGFTSIAFLVNSTPMPISSAPRPLELRVELRWVLDFTPTLNSDGSFTLALRQRNAFMATNTVTDGIFGLPARLFPAAGERAVTFQIKDQPVAVSGFTVPRLTLQDNVIRDDILAQQISDTVLLFRVRRAPTPNKPAEEAPALAPTN